MKPVKKVMKKKTAKKPKANPLRQIAKYIESKGWNVVVVGPARIQQPIGMREFNYELVVNFTGVKK